MRKSRVRWPVKVIAALSASWAVLAASGWAGMLGWQAELFANFRGVPFLVAILAFVLLVRFVNRTAAVLGGVALAAVVAFTLVPRPALPAGTRAGASLKFATWNACFGRVDPRAVQRWVDAAAPDVIAFTEITQQLHGILEKSLRAQYPYTLGNPRSGPNGLAFFSKLPLSNWKRENGRASRYGTCEFRWPGGPVCGLIVAHPPAPTSGRWYWERAETFRELSAMIASERRPLIVMGDFNATWAVGDFREFSRATELLPASQYLPSWNSALPGALRIPIDHVMARQRDFVSISAAVGTEGAGSDHLPVLAEVCLRPLPFTAGR